jgi:hypothetical protein
MRVHGSTHLCVHLRAGRTCEGSWRPPDPARVPSKARNTHALDKDWKAEAAAQRPGAGVSHTRALCPAPGAPAQFGNKINPKVSMGVVGEGDQKGRGPGGEKGGAWPPSQGGKGEAISLPGQASLALPLPSLPLLLPLLLPLPPAPPPSLAAPGELRVPLGPPSPAPPKGNPSTDPTLPRLQG